MTDLLYNLDTMDISIKNGDFEINNDVSQQNAGLILQTEHDYLLNPLLGIGIENVINSNFNVLEFELNRWKTQVLNDGAIEASWSINKDVNGQLLPSIYAKY